MSNFIPNTEDFSAGNWNLFTGMVVTSNTLPAPTFAGVNAGSADKLEDNSAAATALLRSNLVAIPADTSFYIGSMFIRKDAVTSRFPAFIVDFADGSGQFCGVNLNTQTGAIANYFNNFPALLDKGVIDVDSNWWRVWLKMQNDGTSTQARVWYLPCQCSLIGDVDDATLTGFTTNWGVNLTNDSSVQTYIPDPFYSFVGAPNPFVTTIGGSRFGY